MVAQLRYSIHEIGDFCPSTVAKKQSAIMISCFDIEEMGVSKNRGTPKWMVYDGKAY